MSEDRRHLKGSGQSTDLINAPIHEASRISGLRRSEIYTRLAVGDIRAVKSGTRTLVVMDSTRTHLAKPPAAHSAPQGQRDCGAHPLRQLLLAAIPQHPRETKIG